MKGIEINTSFEYEDRIVAFIDILGFRSFVNETVDKESNVNLVKLKKLGESLILIKEEFKKANENILYPAGVTITYFSDSIVISILPTSVVTETLLEVLETLKRVQIKLINNGILLRGGIVQGKIIHNSEMILGPAMISAYDLESKSALYPRITIDPKIIYELFDERGNSLEDHDFRKVFMIDFDNTFYVDYFTDIKHYIADQKEYYQNLRTLIRNGVKRADIGIRMKYLWMLNKFNNSKPHNIQKMKYNGDDEIKEELKFDSPL